MFDTYPHKTAVKDANIEPYKKNPKVNFSKDKKVEADLQKLFFEDAVDILVERSEIPGLNLVFGAFNARYVLKQALTRMSKTGLNVKQSVLTIPVVPGLSQDVQIGATIDLDLVRRLSTAANIR